MVLSSFHNKGFETGVVSKVLERFLGATVLRG